MSFEDKTVYLLSIYLNYFAKQMDLFTKKHLSLWLGLYIVYLI